MVNKSIVPYLIAIGIFILGLIMGLLSHPVEKIDNFIINEKIVKTIKNRTELPYGYKMETNGAEFAYVNDDGYRTLFPSDSLEEAIEAAWSYYEYEYKKNNETWKKFELKQE